MPLATEVNLPKGHPARFPDRCVVCGGESPGSTTRVRGSDEHAGRTWFGLIMPIMHLWGWAAQKSVAVPACRGCAVRLHFGRYASFAVMIAVVVAAFWWIWPLVQDHVPRGARRFTMLGIGIVCLAPYIIFETFFPHAIEIGVSGQGVDYRFRRADIAHEFAELNEDAEWVTIE